MTTSSNFSQPGVRTRYGAFILAALLACLLAQASNAIAAQPAAAEGGDPHYTPVGFFDVHVCNWPDQALFFMTLFSTTRFNDVQDVQVIEPDGHVLGSLDLTKFRTVLQKGMPEKRVFITHMPVTSTAQNGWYLARILLKDGSTFVAKDYVIVSTMPRVNGFEPAADAKLAAVPAELAWNPVPGAQYYQVFIKDLWNGDQVIYTSKILAQPRLPLPPGLLQRGGEYTWRVHARDTNGHILLGDFNHGSLSREVGFSIAP